MLTCVSSTIRHSCVCAGLRAQRAGSVRGVMNNQKREQHTMYFYRFPDRFLRGDVLMAPAILNTNTHSHVHVTPTTNHHTTLHTHAHSHTVMNTHTHSPTVITHTHDAWTRVLDKAAAIHMSASAETIEHGITSLLSGRCLMNTRGCKGIVMELLILCSPFFSQILSDVRETMFNAWLGAKPNRHTAAVLLCE